MKSEYRISLPAKTLDSQDAGARSVLEKAKAQVGFIPNMYSYMANDPGLLETYLDGYHRFRKDSKFTAIEQEIVFLTISRFNGCDYCMAAHSMLAEKASRVPSAFTEAIRDDRPISDPKIEELRKFTVALLATRGLPSQRDAMNFIAAGYDESNILNIIHAIAIKTLSNYSNHLFHTPVDAVFENYAWTPIHVNSIYESEKPPVLGHTIYGNGKECVLVLHDWMGDSENYDSLIPYLDLNKYTYVFADLRGYGKSRHLKGEFTLEEATSDLFSLVNHLNWGRYHLVGHSMTGMVVQAMALDDTQTGSQRIKSVVAITPVAANGYPADEGTKQFLWSLIHKRHESEQGFALLTGKRLSKGWQKTKTERHLKTSSEEALKGYYRMWLETDFSTAIKKARIKLPFLVIGGRKDLPGFQEDFLRSTFGAWYEKALFSFIEDAGHYPMQETPVLLGSLIEGFIERNH
jgi:uncharacterized peroxidase-related enzyme